MAPPELARDTPRLDVLHPVVPSGDELGGNDFQISFTNSTNSLEREKKKEEKSQ